MRKSYPSDITLRQFEIIRPMLENAKKQTKPRTVDLYEVFCAVLYVLDEGCTWRGLPGDFPKWQTVYSYFSIWKNVSEKGSLLDRILRKQIKIERRKNGRKDKTTLLVVDSQSVKNSDTAGSKGYDAGKKISGIKRHIAVDSQGLPHAVAVTTADVTDRNGALLALKAALPALGKVRKVLCDGGYTGATFVTSVKKLIKNNIKIEIAKRRELHKFTVIPKRWVVERDFSWLDKFRRLWKNCERNLDTSLNFIYLAFFAILIRRL